MNFPPLATAAVDAAARQIVITEPGVYDMTSAEYHADPVEGGSLTSTGARMILRSPAHYRYWLDNPKKPTDEMLFGSAVHTLVLGRGEKIKILDFKDYKSGAAQAAKAEAIAIGEIPILPHKLIIAERMAEVVHNHPTAGPLLTGGKPEQVLIWRSHGIWRRAMIDYLKPGGGIDYKSTTSCELHKLSTTINDYKYHQQQPWYTDGIRAVTNCLNPDFKFIFQEKEEPYAVRVVELHIEDVMQGEEDNIRAMAIYRECRALDEWPSYPEHPAVVTIPTYARRKPEHPSCL